MTDTLERSLTPSPVRATRDEHPAPEAAPQLPAPRELRERLPLDAAARALVERSRSEVAAVLRGDDPRLLVVAGPCSLHDPDAALDYGRRLAAAARQHGDKLLIVMRSYFEKPRTVDGWKGLIVDPGLDGSMRIGEGLEVARSLARELLGLGLPLAGELLDPLLAPYLHDVFSWGAVGARTTESQVHRHLASGMPFPVGFKNGTDGSVHVAVDACRASAVPQTFAASGADGRIGVATTAGNMLPHVILRGGRAGPNWDAASVAEAAQRLDRHGLVPRLIVDASHGNSGKDHDRQEQVALALARQIAQGGPIAGVMLESFLVPGRQDLGGLGAAGTGLVGTGLVYGQSVTDACLGWAPTERVLGALADAVRPSRL